MKKYYCVVSTFDDYGQRTASIVDCKVADKMPASTFEETEDKEIYTDWFDSLMIARGFVEELLKDALISKQTLITEQQMIMNR